MGDFKGMFTWEEAQRLTLVCPLAYNGTRGIEVVEELESVLVKGYRWLAYLRRGKRSL